MLVRTSHFTFEEFDPNKIANALIKEAKIPADIAQKTAKDTEKLLLKSKIKYLTAPLIREIVNAILIEKGMEDYRHKLTRLGLPVHEVATLIESKDKTVESEATLIMAGKTVFREYMLLNVFPRDIADAHVSGALHINGLSTWILKPNEIIHDLRFFFQNGLRIGNIDAFRHSEKPADTFESALSTVVNVLIFSHKEVNQTQTLDHFNLFLSPYIKDIDPVKIKDTLKHFLITINQLVDTTIAFELTVPEFITDKPAIGPQGKICGKYIDYIEESKLLAELTVEIYLEENAIKPFLNPKLVFKIDKDAILDDKSRDLLLKAHELVANQGAIYFGNILQKEAKSIAYSATGIKLEANITDDWETDTLRTGCLGHVTINLPRIAHECDKDKAKFFDLLKERCELAARAIAIKNRALKQYGKNNLPFLMHGVNGDSYFRLENCSGIISFAGLKETTEKFTNKPSGQQENLKFAEEIVQNAQIFMQKIGRKQGRRLFLSILQSREAAIRLAQLDIEKFGIAKVKFSGTRDKPFYSTTRRIQLQAGNFASVPSDQLDWEHKLKGLNAGGNLTIIDMDDVKHEPEELLKLTMYLMEKQSIEFLTYSRIITYCSNCQKSWIEKLHKCPSCGAMGTLIVFDRFLST